MRNRLVRYYDPEIDRTLPVEFQVRGQSLAESLETIGALELAKLVRASWKELVVSGVDTEATRLSILEPIEDRAFQWADAASAVRESSPHEFRCAVRAWLALADACNELRGVVASTRGTDATGSGRAPCNGATG